MADNLDKLKYKGLLNKGSDTSSVLRKRVDAIYRSDKTPAEKRQLIDEVTGQANKLKKTVVTQARGAFD